MKQDKKKTTGISNFWLYDDIYFIHYSMLIAMFAPSHKNIRHKKDISLDGVNRVFKHKKFDALCNTRFLNIEYDFKVYIYLLKQLELINRDVNKDFKNLELEFTVDTMSVLKFLGKDEYRKTHFNNLYNSLSKLRKASLVYKTINETTESGLISQFSIIGEGSKSSIKVSFPDNILNIFNFKRQVRIDINKLNKYCKNGGEAKIFLILNNYNNIKNKEFVDFDYEFLKQTLGFEEYHSKNGVVREFYKSKNSRSNINNYKKGLIDSGFLVDVENNDKYNYKLIQKRNLKDFVEELDNNTKQQVKDLERSIVESQIDVDLSDLD